MDSVLRWTRPVPASNESRTVNHLCHLWLTARPLYHPFSLTHRPLNHLLPTPSHPLRAKASKSACHCVISPTGGLLAHTATHCNAACHSDFGHLWTHPTYLPDIPRGLHTHHDLCHCLPKLLQPLLLPDQPNKTPLNPTLHPSPKHTTPIRETIECLPDLK